MTGFARASGALDGLHWQWEVKSVNAKGLDVRCRLPTGFEALEQPVRAAAAERLKRGTLQVSLNISGASQRETVQLNETVLAQVLKAAEHLHARVGGEPIRADVILGMRGVLEGTVAEEDEAAISQRNATIMISFQEALAAVVASRREEGQRLQSVITAQIDRIENLGGAARDNPTRSAAAIKSRLAEQMARLMETAAGLDENRLYQEAMLIATRADIQEELDRLMSHIKAARILLASGEAIGREFDFLAQEFNREANTLCAKAVDKTLTATGLDLKIVIDQLREQVQNIE
ncbi:MAG TPA: YicC/YloC family endoribonuclease [Aestuariivirga sp.]|nr:YicC/YloC family endoribonuclease [Aestuariivirga sp.]